MAEPVHYNCWKGSLKVVSMENKFRDGPSLGHIQHQIEASVNAEWARAGVCECIIHPEHY